MSFHAPCGVTPVVLGSRHRCVRRDRHHSEGDNPRREKSMQKRCKSQVTFTYFGTETGIVWGSEAERRCQLLL